MKERERQDKDKMVGVSLFFLSLYPRQSVQKIKTQNSESVICN